jgi:hypothetical protein
MEFFQMESESTTFPFDPPEDITVSRTSPSPLRVSPHPELRSAMPPQKGIAGE